MRIVEPWSSENSTGRTTVGRTVGNSPGRLPDGPFTAVTVNTEGGVPVVRDDDF